jgi:hypothetical protein
MSSGRIAHEGVLEVGPNPLRVGLDELHVLLGGRASSQGVVSIETVIATMKPLVTHCARSCPSPKCRDRSGMATFTTVDDMTDAIVPTITVSSKSQR